MAIWELGASAFGRMQVEVNKTSLWKRVSRRIAQESDQETTEI